MDPNFPPLRDQSFLQIDRPLRLLRNRVLLKKVYRDQSTTLWTPTERLPMAGVVLAVGPGEINEKTGFVWPNYVAVGQRIIVSPHEGVEITWYGEPALIVREDEVLAVFDEPPPWDTDAWDEPEGWTTYHTGGRRERKVGKRADGGSEGE